MKAIKFDLPINGTKVRNLEELRDNLTDEIVALARSGQLERWLKTRQLPEQAQAVAEAVQQEGSDKGLFLVLCQVLDIKLHPDVMQFGLPINGIKAKSLDELRDNLTDEILALALSGELERWFRTRQLPEQAQAVVAAVHRGGTEKCLFLALCKVLDIELHPDDVKVIFYSSPVPGNFSRSFYCHKNKDIINNKLHKEIYSRKFIKINFLQKISVEISRLPSMRLSIFGCDHIFVTKIYVKKGDVVKKGDLFFEVENYKSTCEIKSPVSGVVEDIFVEIGKIFKIDKNLMSILETDV